MEMAGSEVVVEASYHYVPSVHEPLIGMAAGAHYPRM
jgi:hypothetical protein